MVGAPCEDSAADQQVSLPVESHDAEDHLPTDEDATEMDVAAASPCSEVSFFKKYISKVIIFARVLFCELRESTSKFNDS